MRINNNSNKITDRTEGFVQFNKWVLMIAAHMVAELSSVNRFTHCHRLRFTATEKGEGLMVESYIFFCAPKYETSERNGNIKLHGAIKLQKQNETENTSISLLNGLQNNRKHTSSMKINRTYKHINGKRRTKKDTNTITTKSYFYRIRFPLSPLFGIVL